MTQKSGLKMIEELLNKVELLDRRFVVVEQNMKELLNRANGFAPPAAMPNGPSITGSEPSPTSMEAMNANVIKATTDTTKVMGKIKNKEGQSLIGVKVGVVKENGEVVKETKTNRAGDWMCFLPVGIYKASYFIDKQINATVSISVNPEQTLIRVAQPKWE